MAIERHCFFLRYINYTGSDSTGSKLPFPAKTGSEAKFLTLPVFSYWWHIFASPFSDRSVKNENLVQKNQKCDTKSMLWIFEFRNFATAIWLEFISSFQKCKPEENRPKNVTSKANFLIFAHVAMWAYVMQQKCSKIHSFSSLPL